MLFQSQGQGQKGQEEEIKSKFIETHVWLETLSKFVLSVYDNENKPFLFSDVRNV